jgi:tyrosine-protein kinase Etk/Wzc
MSKYYDETLKAQEQKPRASESSPVDVVSLVDAIKHATPATANAVSNAAKDLHPSGRQMPVLRVGNSLIALSTNDTPRAAFFREAYQSLRTRILRIHETGVRVFMLTSSVMLEGKTLTALNLALVCSQLRDHRVLLVDGDLRSRGLTCLLQIDRQIGLSDLLSGRSSAAQTVLGTDQANLQILGAGTPCWQTADLFASFRWTEFMAWAKDRFSIVLIDAPPMHKLADAELMSAACDGALFVVRASSTSRELALACASRLDKNKFFGVILNGVSDGEGSNYEYYSGPSDAKNGTQGPR